MSEFNKTKRINNFILIPENFFEFKEILYLGSKPNGSKIIITWLKMLAKSLKENYHIKTVGSFPLKEVLCCLYDLTDSELVEYLNILEGVNLVKLESESLEIIPFWRGSSRDRNTSEYKEWRSTVFDRDNYTCQYCMERGKKIEAHHIKPFARYEELRYEVSNGVTLCKQCHKAMHKKGGVA